MAKACETDLVTDSPVPVVAAFDLDGTLTEGGSVFLWLRRLAGTGRAYRAALRLLVPLTVGALRSSQWADSAKERLFHALLAGRDLDQVTEVSRAFAVEHLEHEGRAGVIERLEWHRSKGHAVVIVSASPQIYVDVVGEVLRANGALGTRLAVDPRGNLTGSYLGKNCRGREKMRRLTEWIEARGYPVEPVIYAYGNSRGDRRLLAGATHAYNAGKLGRLGSLRRFPGVKTATAD